MIAKSHAGAAVAAAVSTLLLFASSVSAQQQPNAAQPATQQTSTAPAEFQQVAGQILDVRQVPIRGIRASNTLVLLGTQQGNKVVVDLGDRLQNLNLQPGQFLQARGRVVEIENRRAILLADAFRSGGLTYDVNRVAFLQPSEAAPAVAGAKPSAGAPAAESAAAKPAEGEAAKPAEGKPAGAASSASTATPTETKPASDTSAKPSATSAAKSPETKPASGANASSTGTTATSPEPAAGAGKTDSDSAAAGSAPTSNGAAKPGQ